MLTLFKKDIKYKKKTFKYFYFVGMRNLKNWVLPRKVAVCITH